MVSVYSDNKLFVISFVNKKVEIALVRCKWMAFAELGIDWRFAPFEGT